MVRNTDPRAINMLPTMPQTLGPYLSKIVPTGKAQTFVATAAVVNIKLSLTLPLDRFSEVKNP